MNFIAGFAEFLLILMLVASASAVSIQGGNHDVTFKPGATYSYSYTLGRADAIDTYVAGDFPDVLKYVTIDDSTPGGGPRSITATINFPQSVPPGKYVIYIGAKEHVEQNAPIGGVAAIQSRISVNVLYPGKFLQASYGMPDANVNERVPVSVGVTSYGTEEIAAVSGRIEVYDPDSKLVSVLTTNSISLASDVSSTLATTLDTKGFVKGNYHTNLTVFYDGAVLGPFESSFRVGTPELAVRNYTREFAKDAVGKLDVIVESNWNGKFTNVYATINVLGATLQTPSQTTDQFGSATLSTYWDTKGLAYESYPATITAHYTYKDSLGKEQEASQIADATFVVTPAKEPIDERPAWFKTNITFTSSTVLLLYGLVAVLIIVNLLFLWRRKQPPAANPPASSSAQSPSSAAQGQNPAQSQPPSAKR